MAIALLLHMAAAASVEMQGSTDLPSGGGGGSGFVRSSRAGREGESFPADSAVHQKTDDAGTARPPDHCVLAPPPPDGDLQIRVDHTVTLFPSALVLASAPAAFAFNNGDLQAIVRYGANESHGTRISWLAEPQQAPPFAQRAQSEERTYACQLKDAPSKHDDVAPPSLSLPAFFGSAMVLQHSKPVELWGYARSGQTVRVTLQGTATLTAAASVAGRWSVLLKAQPASNTPRTIQITTSNEDLVLEDVVFGSVFVCSGQSNMALGVSASVNASAELAGADSHGPGLRILNVRARGGPTDPYLCNVTDDRHDMLVATPWSRPNATNTAPFSAFCFFFGVRLQRSHPSVPVGLIASAWGGTVLEVWMSKESLASCAESSWPQDNDGALAEHMRDLTQRSPDRGFAAAMFDPAGTRECGVPMVPSTLWRSMIFPLTSLRLAGILWYQG